MNPGEGGENGVTKVGGGCGGKKDPPKGWGGKNCTGGEGSENRSCWGKQAELNEGGVNPWGGKNDGGGDKG